MTSPTRRPGGAAAAPALARVALALACCTWLAACAGWRGPSSGSATPKAPAGADSQALGESNPASQGDGAGVVAAPADGGRAARPSATLPPPPTPDPFVARGQPVALDIPAIGVRTTLEILELNAENEVEVPEDWGRAGWYRIGFKPGEPGMALIAGHLDDERGQPAVFWDLDKLAEGDEVTVTYANGDRYTFRVEGQSLLDAESGNAGVMRQAVAASETPRLSLMTCDGAWDRGEASYSKRLVVGARMERVEYGRDGGAAGEVDGGG